MYILDVCSDISVLGVILFIKKLVIIISYIVPAILILLITIDFTKAVMANSDDDIKRAQRLAIKRIIAGLIVFFIPLVVETSFSLLEDNGPSWTSCYNNATDQKIDSLVSETKNKSGEKEKERQTGISSALDARKKKQKKDRLLREKAKKKAAENAKKKKNTVNLSTCTNCTGSEKIAQTAELLAWPEKTPRKKYISGYRNKKFTSWAQLNKAKPTKAFMDAMDKVYPNHFKWGTGYPAIRTGQSCDTFVGIVVAASGYDKIGRTYGQLKNACTAHKTKWKKVDSAARGDICMNGKHVKIYLGNEKIAQASYGSHFGFITNGNCKSYTVYRARQ